MSTKSVSWNDGQLRAISTETKEVLVSAAAGSGKTAVLVERIKQLILSGRVSADRLLVVTFTRAAAAEMREKIIKAINDAIEERPAEHDRLREQLDKAYTAQICTFHSFALDLIRQYFHLLDIDPDIRICDDTEAVMMKNDAMDRVFEEFFESGDQVFLDYLTAYSSGKNENDVKEQCIIIYDRLQSMADPQGWLHDAVLALDADEEEFMKSSLFETVMTYMKSQLGKAAELLDEAADLSAAQGTESVSLVLAADVKSVAAAAAMGSFDDIEAALSSFSWGRLACSRDEKDAYEEIKPYIRAHRENAKKIITDLTELCGGADIREQVWLMNQVFPMAGEAEKIINRFEQIYSEMKAGKKLVDFNDIEHMAIRILGDPQAAEECREKYQYIFIDEYQDSNYLQEEIIGRIKQKGRLFMVGDIKQSIYMFRLAEPDIFRSKYESFAEEGTDGCDQGKIELNVNYRSKGHIITAINDIFGPLMYTEEGAALHKGVEYEGELDRPAEFHIIDGAEGEEDTGDAELDELKTAELEAMAAAKIIRDSLGMTIYDSKRGEERPLEKRDIVIIMRSMKGTGEIFYDTLMSNGVDAYIDDNSGYFDTVEIITFMDLLRTIDNRKRDIPLLGVLRSSIFGFSIDDLIKIRLTDKGSSFHEALEKYEHEGQDRELAAHISETLASLNKWKKMSAYVPIDEFVWKLMDETGYYTYAGALPGGRQRQANLRAMADRAAVFREKGHSSIYGLITYIDNMTEHKVDTAQVSLIGEEDDTVRIMTAHKSKGLEFPMVIVAGLGRRFNFDKTEKKGSFHKDIGFGMTYVDRKAHLTKRTIAEKAIMLRKRQEQMEEEMRILYVAATRAMDRLIFTAGVKNWEKEKEKFAAGAQGTSRYLDIVYPAVEDSSISVAVDRREDLADMIREEASSAYDMMKFISDSEGSGERETEDMVDRKLSYVYPYTAELHLKSKYSVSELNKDAYLAAGRKTGQETEAGPDIPLLRVPQFMCGEKNISAAERGTAVHTVMEHLDFRAAAQALAEGGGREYISRCIAHMIDEEILTEEEAGAADVSAIEAFILSDIGSRAAAAGSVSKETEFNILHRAEMTDQGTDADSGKASEVMVQGIIDCWFRDEKGLVLLDYKTNYSSEHIKEKYQGQIDLYKEALELTTGENVTEAYIWLFRENRAVRM